MLFPTLSGKPSPKGRWSTINHVASDTSPVSKHGHDTLLLPPKSLDKHASFSNKSADYNEKQSQVDMTIAKGKLDYKTIVENVFSQNKMKDAWKG